MQDALNPAGIQAAHIYALWQVTLALCAVVFAGILVALMLGLRRAARARQDDRPDLRPLREREKGAGRAVLAASLLAAAGLVALVCIDIFTDRSLSRLGTRDALHIEMVGHEWWWEAGYGERGRPPDFKVANELMVPVGRPVVVTLKSADVIHTFWVPNLHGKKDMLPGRSTTIEFRADSPGRYRGQCAEFCGQQHALMALTVTAVSPPEYAAWEAAQRAPAAAPVDGTALRGQQIFMGSNCAQCHAVRGTSAQGALGPDLTHFASRSTIAAGTVANTPRHLAAWIVDPQATKAGSRMPSSPLAPDDVRALVAYLGSLR